MFLTEDVFFDGVFEEEAVLPVTRGEVGTWSRPRLRGRDETLEGAGGGKRLK